MGSGGSTRKAYEVQDDNAIKRSLEIDQYLDEESNKEQPRRVLLLGTGNSGKTTMLKQFKAQFAPKPTEEQVKACREIISQNIIHGLILLVEFLEGTNKKHLLKSETLGLKDVLRNQVLAAGLTIWDEDASGTMYSKMVRIVWNDPEVQRTERLSHTISDNEYQTIYFMKRLDTIVEPDYLPSEQDMLRMRSKTKGLHVVELEIPDNPKLEVIDVGGQQNERKKWIHVFDNVDCVVFIFSLGDIDKRLLEDNTGSRYDDAVECFREIVSNPQFRNTGFIVLMNKVDMLRRMLDEDRDLMHRRFPDYPGRLGHYRDALIYLQNEFQTIYAENEEAEGAIVKQIRPAVAFYPSTATDTENALKIIKGVKDSVFRNSINDIL